MFKLERTLEEQAAAYHLYIEHETRPDIVTTKCLEYVEQNETFQKHLMTFLIIVHTTPKKVNQSLNYHQKIPVIRTNPST